jgi:predicted nucleic acid-binding protein
MNKILLDTSAWVEYFNGSDKGRKVREMLVSAGSFALTTGMVAAELASKFLREGKPADEIMIALRAISVLVAFDYDAAYKTAGIYVRQRKSKPKFGIVDAHIVAAAILNDAKIITCDTDFSGIQEAVVIK